MSMTTRSRFIQRPPAGIRRRPVALATVGPMIAVLLLAAGAAAQPDPPSFILEIEGGAVWQSKNDIQIPNDDTATRFSAIDITGKGPFPAGRATFTWNVNERHGLRFLGAPLTIDGTETITSPINFAGATFAAGVPTTATYQFNSWRATYSYRFYRGSHWTWRIGFTAKIRDAKVELEQPDVQAKDTDVGFVPLLYLFGAYSFNDRFGIELELDALAGGPGRAEDVSLKARYAISRSISLAAGYRTVEGGADVDAVYNFAWLHYAVASIAFGF
jgi:hypothetical protein